MRLERLEISGFKSFPDRSDLAFDHGVTAIVGPNGCGKSNVVDAITWVLGEQSAKSLRGERMEDVIFNGSDARKPTAAAEVRLHLTGLRTDAVRSAAARLGAKVPTGVPGAVVVLEPEQIDLPEAEPRDVELARRLYRSGESEYLINGEVCRLRDIQDLLMDAGMGYKGYAVIEQGKIGQILSAKPTDRRALIEEAAGVTKYKTRRRAAELKLEAAQQNLARIDDVVFEVEKQRNSLKRQAAKARKYRKLREELRRWEKVLLARRYRVLAQAIETARARLAEARVRERSALEKADSDEARLDALRHDLQSADARLTTARDEAHARELEKGRREQHIAYTRQQIESAAALAIELTADLTALDTRREPARAELAARREAASAAEREHTSARERLAHVEASFAQMTRDIAALESELEAARGRVHTALNTRTTLANVIERAADARERLGGDLARLAAEARDLEVQIERLTIDGDAARGLLQAAKDTITRTADARNARQLELANARAERDRFGRELRDAEREVASLGARLTSLVEVDAARSAYGEAARVVLAEHGARLRHHGSVADHIETDRERERAVEACLGDLLQAVLVDDAAAAAEGLSLVRDQNLGRCTFVIVGGGAHQVSPGPRPDGVEPLLDAVRMSGPHADTIRELVSQGWIAPTFEAAHAASAVTSAPVATLAGDLFRGGRLISGGGRQDARSILATKRELKELRDRLADGERHAEELSRELGLLDRRIAEIEGHAAALATELHEQEKAAIGHDLRVKRADEELARVHRTRELVGQEHRRAEEERRALEDRQREAERQIAGLDADQGQLDERFAAAQQRLQAAREGAGAQAALLAEAKAAQAALGERAMALAHEVARLDEASRELEARARSRRDDIARNEQRRETLNRDLAEAEERLAEDQAAFDRLQGEVRRWESEVLDVQARTESADRTTRAARAALEDIRAALSQLEVARATAEADLTHLGVTAADTLQASIDEVVAEVARLEEAGEIAPDPTVIFAEEEEEGEEEEGDEDRHPAVIEQAAAQPTGAPSEAPAEGAGPKPTPAGRALTAEDAIAELKAKIERLGPVNMIAIEQFSQLDERHGFLTAQRTDLVESIAQTGEAIKRIERTTHERFREAFTAINKYFEETFATLFGGGRAGLLLLDEDDLLESGIDIIAQPPGKRLQNVSLLSGGEKALTAMALMFAIFKYRPSPFCLLDEIDAPLDDANIARFLEMLHGLLDQTQFIIITHSRKTMEMADRLYGVTMEEPGVSKLISIRLN